MDYINIFHKELSIVAQFFSLNIVFIFLKLAGIILVFVLVGPAIQKITGIGNRLNSFLELSLKWFFTYVIFVFFFQSLVKSYAYAPYLSVIFSILFLFIIVIPVTLYLLSFLRFMSLFINKYFQIGDQIKIDHFQGRIRKIGFFNVQLYQEDGNTVMIPLRMFLINPVKVIHSRNFSLFERSYNIKNISHYDQFHKTVLFKLKNLPYEMDLENIKVKIIDDQLNIKIKYGPSYVRGAFGDAIDKLIQNLTRESV